MSNPIYEQIKDKPARPAFNREWLLNLHEETCQAAVSLMDKKNHDYAGKGGEDPFANFRASEMLGVPKEKLLLCRALDKFQRINTFLDAGSLKVSSESVHDAIIDVINYMVLLRGMVVEAQDGTAVKT